MSAVDFVPTTAAERREWERLLALQVAFDPGTFRRLGHRAVHLGWHCLEVGPGAGSVVRWLAERVGPSGQVVALDLDTRFVAPLRSANVEVRPGNVVAGGLGERCFDLIHARLVLMHIPERERVLDHLVRALKPGGWLLIEDADFDTARPAEEALAMARAFEATRAFYRQIGTDASFGRRLPTLFQRLGLQGVVAEVELALVQGGTPRAHVGRFPSEHLAALLSSTGSASAADIAEFLRLLDDPTCWFLDFALIAAWGQRPFEG